MKKKVSALLAASFLLALVVFPSTAIEDDAYFEVNQYPIDIEDAYFEVNQYPVEAASVDGLHYTQTISFSVPGDGEYHRVTGTSFDIAKGNTVDINTTWGPAATSIWIDFRTETGDAVAVHLTGGNGSATLTFPSTGLYYLNVMSDRYAASGTISLTW